MTALSARSWAERNEDLRRRRDDIDAAKRRQAEQARAMQRADPGYAPLFEPGTLERAQRIAAAQAGRLRCA